MSLDLSSVQHNNMYYKYDRNELTKALEEKGLSPEDVLKVLGEVESGDLQSIWSLKLNGYFSTDDGEALPLPQFKPTLEEYASLLAKFEGINMLEVLLSLHEAGQKLRDAALVWRHAEREIVVTEALNSAQKIRSAAIANLVVGVVSGAINIGMGAFSAGSATKQLAMLKSAQTNLKTASLETKALKADAKLEQSQIKLQEARVAAAAKQKNLTEMEAQVAAKAKASEDVKVAKENLKTLQDEQLAEMNAASADAKAELRVKQNVEFEAAQADLAAKQKVLDELPASVPTDAEVAQAKIDLDEANATVSRLEAEVKLNAVEAQKANAERTSNLEKNVKAKEEEIARLEKEQSDVLEEISIETKNAGDLKKAGAPQADIDLAEGRVASAMERHALIDEQLTAANNSLPDLKVSLADSKARAEIYKDPTAPASLDTVNARQQFTKTNLSAAEQKEALARMELDMISLPMQTRAAQLQGYNTAAGGISQALQGVGGMIAADQQARGAEDTAESQKAASKESEAAEFQKSAEELLSSIRNILKDTLQAFNQANASIYRNM